MRLDHEFTVPVPAAQAWPVLLDIDRIAPCMPGATITKVDGDDFEGTVKVKVGPITVTYAGSASFIVKDEAGRMAVIEARAKETRGSGTATARITAQLFENDEGTARVAVSTDLSITGKPAQFGRGVMNDVGAKLLGRFADCLASELGTDPALAAPAPAPAGAVPASVAAGAPAQSQDTTELGSAPVTSPADTGVAAAGTGTGGVIAGITEPATGDDAAAVASLGSSGDAPADPAGAAPAELAAAAASGTVADSGTGTGTGTGSGAGTNSGTGTGAGSGPSAAGPGTAPATEGAGDPPTAGTAPGPDAPAAVLDASPRAAAQRPEAEPIDLMEAAGGAVAKRAVPLVGALALLAVLVATLRRRTR